MSYKTARNLTAACYTVALVVVLAGILNFDTGSSARTICIVVGVVLILAGAVIRLRGCNCPQCGEHIEGRLLDTVKCPKCGAELMPKKVRKSKKNN